MKRTFLFLLAFHLLHCSLYAGSGTKGLQFLRVGVGGRACGMGEAFVALSDDASATYWNPSGIASIEGREIILMHNRWFCNTRQEFASIIFPLLKLATAGISVTYFDYGEIEGMNEFGQETGTYSAYDLAVGISVARSLTQGFFVALTGKLIQSRIDTATGSGSAFDAGMLLQTPIEDLRLGCAVLNLGRGITFVNETTPLPTLVRVGVSYSLRSPSFSIIPSLDFAKEIEGDLTTHAGMELSVVNRIFLRGGYKAAASHKGLTTGMGIAHGLSFCKLVVDYAYADYRDIGNSHKISMGINM